MKKKTKIAIAIGTIVVVVAVVVGIISIKKNKSKCKLQDVDLTVKDYDMGDQGSQYTGYYKMGDCGEKKHYCRYTHHKLTDINAPDLDPTTLSAAKSKDNKYNKLITVGTGFDQNKDQFAYWTCTQKKDGVQTEIDQFPDGFKGTRVAQVS